MRDYNKEMKDNDGREYFYGFDYDVMHPLMARSIRPFLKKGSMLELGSFEGHLTEILLKEDKLNEITCIEASSEAISNVKESVSSKVKIINSMFENYESEKRHENILMTHVLEHLDDPVSVLKTINDKWLTDDGLFYLICPNANAPSRQIAVKMGLITHNAAVTPAEHLHGHRITYSLDTLERDATDAGLNVISRSGIFFKALANFQWDRLLKTDIISEEYLEGCYQLGQQYPDLCSSIMLVCKKG